MKKIVAIALLALSLCTLAGCSDKPAAAPTNSTAPKK